MGRMAELHMEQERFARTPPRQQYAIAKLVGYCEAIAASGLIGEVMEYKLRLHIAETLSAFKMELHADNLELEPARTITVST